ncbi:ABC transporter permease [Paenibacillus sp. PsM32]|uniref:ABC transporter permease n=1 Tax=Paenibacillus kyungheensis TaxID=1452732 RepID=A0AAX3LWY7_9BACL|nr:MULTISPECIES: ABC transporter permease [Paenibacillus]MDN4617805.1 ABC transporter permease [Paenibacillus sp. PsM32]MDQ1234535.1 peptide/nickel transport system permease protein [Paenibacillus sp. SORGH_AS_0306]MDR6111582.1 peptide/nickel transport system permease protein [Paenibacillus sp. SORGH_AS_0338]WCT54135.1 ABC transporter permease [Paenibacillus kyungheensis]
MGMRAQTFAPEETIQKSPSSWSILGKELIKDKMAMLSLIFLALFLIVIYGSVFFIDQEAVTKVDLTSIKAPPSADHWLGTDRAGSDIFGQVVIGARNSITIAFAITIFAAVIGLSIGLIAGFFGGIVDNIIMRFIDFILVLPFLMLVIVFVTIVPKYNIWSFIFIMTAFLWVGKARLIRAKVLAERELDYVQASKTLGTPNWKIIAFGILPNLSSIVIVNMTLNLAGNIGIETGLSFLGFGLPQSTPSLGTIVSNATDPDILQNYWWMWLPASLLILVLILAINFVGQALKRATDARQRLG